MNPVGLQKTNGACSTVEHEMDVSNANGLKAVKWSLTG
jgi:hypothetical protein